MKNLKNFINEAMNALPKEFLDIWKGKHIKIDSEYFNNPSLLSQSIMDVHRRELPTEKEFMNLCEWMIDSKLSVNVIEAILLKMVEVFGSENTIRDLYGYDPNRKPGERTYILAKDTHHTDKTEIQYFFLLHDIIKQGKNALTNKGGKHAEYADDIVNGHAKEKGKVMLKKWNKTVETWPDYSEGYYLLQKTLK